jgi:hypothetical protein
MFSHDYDDGSIQDDQGAEHQDGAQLQLDQAPVFLKCSRLSGFEIDSPAVGIL